MSRFARTAVAALLLALPGCAAPLATGSTPTAAPTAPPRVVFIVGDGVASAQWSLARIAADGPLAVARLPEIGLVDTRCACRRVTDSAAGATAYATGMRTFYRGLSIAPDSTPMRTVLEVAEARGMATGLVTTTVVVDATPAAFASHVPDRARYEDIAAQIAARQVEVLLGNGRAAFDPVTRADRRDLLGEMRRRATYVATPAELAALALDTVDALVGLFAPMDVHRDSIRQRPPLPEMARAALAVLDRDPDGFFLLIESEMTDELGHANARADSLAASMLELDRTVAAVLEYQARHPETLVVVVGDHETGGLAVMLDEQAGGAPVASYRNTGHSANMVTLFAGGPGAGRFGRMLDNAEVGNLLRQAVGGGPLPEPLTP